QEQEVRRSVAERFERDVDGGRADRISRTIRGYLIGDAKAQALDRPVGASSESAHGVRPGGGDESDNRRRRDQAGHEALTVQGRLVGIVYDEILAWLDAVRGRGRDDDWGRMRRRADVLCGGEVALDSCGEAAELGAHHETPFFNVVTEEQPGARR